MSSDGKTQGAATNSAQLTEREKEILTQAWGCLNTVPEVDYSRLAEAVGMTNPRSASNAWSVIKKKLFSDIPATPKKGRGAASAAGTPADSEKKRKRATPAKKAAAAADDGDENMAEAAATPSKKRRSPAKKAAPKKNVVAEEDDEEEEIIKAEGLSDEAVKDEGTSDEADKTIEAKVDDVDISYEA